jgi:hypothetical protein
MIEFTEWAVRILTRTHEAARRFNPEAVVRLSRHGDEYRFVLTDAPLSSDRKIEHEGFVLLVEEGIEGTVDVIEPHDQLIVRPPAG